MSETSLIQSELFQQALSYVSDLVRQGIDEKHIKKALRQKRFRKGDFVIDEVIVANRGALVHGESFVYQTPTNLSEQQIKSLETEPRNILKELEELDIEFSKKPFQHVNSIYLGTVSFRRFWGDPKYPFNERMLRKIQNYADERAMKISLTAEKSKIGSARLLVHDTLSAVLYSFGYIASDSKGFKDIGTFLYGLKE